MIKYHITEKGPKKCTAKTPESCTVLNSGEAILPNHYEDIIKAEKAYEEEMSIKYGDTITVAKGKVLNGNNQPRKNGSYYGVEVKSEEISEALEVWKNNVSNWGQLEKAKIERDGSLEFHMTILSPKETRGLKKNAAIISEESFNFEAIGIGKAETEKSEAWFIVMKSPEAQEYRKGLGLEEKDFHITLGFSSSDIHNKTKDERTILYRFS